MSPDTRKTTRVKTSMSCIFGVTQDTPRSGTVTSISVTGCFVKTKGWATKGQKMYFRLWLPEGRWLPLHGTVIYHLETIGFGLLFEETGLEDENTLRSLILQEAAGTKTPAAPEGDLAPE
ncbi:MAG TPA: PilZ domain-containing protein [Pyrinomonadaceae bacterium]|nr:PilZ domain-containing protein [Pyrinomonadaceae bacterium]